MLSLFREIEHCVEPYYKPRLKLFQNLLGPRVIDALLHFPNYSINKYYTDEISDSYLEKIVTIKVKIDCIDANYGRPSAPSIVYTTCGDKVVEILLFNYKRAYIKTTYPIGSTVCISGKLLKSDTGGYRFINPEKVAISRIDSYKGLFNIYPLTTGLNQNAIYSVLKSALNTLEKADIKEWLPGHIMQRNSFDSFYNSLKEIHHPSTVVSNKLQSNAYKRLVFDELLAEQLVIRLSSPRSRDGILIKNERSLINKLLALLPFSLTESQNEAISEIFGDFESGKPMARLLQGDVGSGKTIVALVSILNAIESGYQTALLAPTEILARQHFSNLKKYFDLLGLSIEILTSNEKGKKRKEILENVASGKTNLLVGTHAIITDKVDFDKLGFVVIDEQHRFGVNQRLQLIQKGTSPHVLSMTATPIPRTIIMSLYGDINVSSIKEKPKGRKEIITKTVPISRIDEMVGSIQTIIDRGERVYWICPLIEENEKLKYTCVINRFEFLKKHFSKEGEVGILHGKMKAQDKQDIFKKFESGECKILVSTTVIEVGVDVPSATVIIIENAEKFGLAQLHQLRGRVGRSDLQSYCILLYNSSISEIASKRLRIIRDTNDGFLIAEQDLILRGGGEIIGTRQSGEKSYKTFDINESENQTEIYDLMKQASTLATEIVNKDQISQYEILLKIFGHDNFENIKLSF